jgi:hypothetical protein
VPLAGLMPKRGTFVGTDFNRIHASARRPPWFATGSTEKAKKKRTVREKITSQTEAHCQKMGGNRYEDLQAGCGYAFSTPLNLSE